MSSKALTPAIKSLNRRFVYTPDRSDKWTILNDPKGKLNGDCEDYVLSVLYRLAGEDIDEMYAMVKRKEAFLVFTHTAPGKQHGHMMLWVKGLGWIDCNNQQWSDLPHYRPEQKLGIILFRFRMWYRRASLSYTPPKSPAAA